MIKEKKIKVAVFGIGEAILRTIRKEIDPRKAEVVLFFDNDKRKNGTYYMDVPVLFPTEDVLKMYAVDYVLIAALSAYQVVKVQLINLGVCKERIQVFVTADLCNYCLGSIDDIDMELIHTIYFEPLKWIEKIERYKQIYAKYSQIAVFDEEPNAWFNKSTLISHACGGVVNGKKIMYSNSKEAFTYSMNEGFRLVECDMLGIEEGELLLAHDYERFYEAQEEQYSMMTAREFIGFLKMYPDVNCLIDVKWDNRDEYRVYICGIENLIKELSVNDDEGRKLKNQIVMEVYDEETIKLAREKNFHMIFTQYRNPDGTCFMNTANLCYEYGVKAVALPLGDEYWNEKKYIKILTDKNIKIFVFSTDSISDYQKLKEIGVTGIFTNYLTEKDIE